MEPADWEVENETVLSPEDEEILAQGQLVRDQGRREALEIRKTAITDELAAIDAELSALTVEEVADEAKAETARTRRAKKLPAPNPESPPADIPVSEPPAEG